jgi:hypothetical protein
MNDTYVFSLADSVTAIKSYKAYGGVWEWDFLENTYGDKNIYTTPRDLLKWSLAWSQGEWLILHCSKPRLHLTVLNGLASTTTVWAGVY